MDWNTALSKEWKRANAAAKRAIAKREGDGVAIASPAPPPANWHEALKRLRRRLLRKARRTDRIRQQMSQDLQAPAE
jgi:hypothetical protein